MSELSYDDFAVGETYEFDGVRLSKTDIVEFGRQYDPLSFHTDEDAAAGTPYDGVIASGLQTFAVSQRQVVDHLYGRAAIYGSVGFDDWPFPTPSVPGTRSTRPSRCWGNGPPRAIRRAASSPSSARSTPKPTRPCFARSTTSCSSEPSDVPVRRNV